jgi:hypothetical protein
LLRGEFIENIDKPMEINALGSSEKRIDFEKLEQADNDLEKPQVEGI